MAFGAESPNIYVLRPLGLVLAERCTSSVGVAKLRGQHEALARDMHGLAMGFGSFPEQGAPIYTPNYFLGP